MLYWNLVRVTLLVIIAALVLAGCATQPTPPVLLPCPAALDLPGEPARFLKTDPAAPGATVRAAVINRAAWIAHADELTTRLNSCK